MSNRKISGRAKQKRPKKPPFNLSQKSWGRVKKTFSVIGRTLLTIFLIGVITGCIVAGALTIYVVRYVKPDKIELSKEKLDYTTILYANDTSGKPQEMTRLRSDQNRIWVDLKNVPQNLRNAFISTEDMRFYEHEGVDYRRTFGAVINYFVPFNKNSGGGSTITQQLVKNVTGKNEVSPMRKIQEMVTALDLEKRYSKDQILESYLNTINLGEGYGVQAAANAYFGEDVSKLDLAQCALLAGLTKAPSSYNPFLHPDRAQARQKIVLLNMLNQKMITRDQYDKALAEKLTYTKAQTTAQKNAINSYFVDQVITDVTSDLMAQKGYTRQYALNLLYNKGLQIYTTEDPRIQSIMENVYTDSSKWVKLAGTEQPQSAMLIVDYSGQIRGVVGGRGQKPSNMCLDRATKSKRQPGSTIKPLAVYGPAIEYDKITWSTMVQDAYKINVKDDKSGAIRGWPNNDTGAPSGAMLTVQQGLARSVNTIAAGICISDLGNGTESFDFMTKKLGFTSLVYNRNGHTDRSYYISIGAITDGVTVREMAGGYEIFGNGGKYIAPYTYTKVLDSDGKVLLENKGAAVQAISPDTSTIVNKLMQTVITDPSGTASYLRSTSFGGMAIAGKTGTTSNNNDRWFVGMTPYYVGAVWYGYDQQREVVTKANNPAAIAWKNVMTQVMSGLAYKDFPVSSGVVQQTYDKSTGLLTSGGANTAVGWYKSDNLPQQAQVSAASSSVDISSSSSSSLSSGISDSGSVPSSSASSASTGSAGSGSDNGNTNNKGNGNNGSNGNQQTVTTTGGT